jgi:hypothetical protein
MTDGGMKDQPQITHGLEIMLNHMTGNGPTRNGEAGLLFAASVKSGNLDKNLFIRFINAESQFANTIVADAGEKPLALYLKEVAEVGKLIGDNLKGRAYCNLRIQHAGDTENDPKKIQADIQAWTKYKDKHFPQTS